MDEIRTTPLPLGRPARGCGPNLGIAAGRPQATGRRISGRPAEGEGREGARRVDDGMFIIMLAGLLASGIALFFNFRVGTAAGGSRGLEFGVATSILVLGLAAHLTLNAYRGHLSPLWPGLLFPLAYACFHFGSFGGGISWYLPERVDEAWHLATLGLLGWLFGYNLVRGRHRIAPDLVLSGHGTPIRQNHMACLRRLGQLCFYAGVGLQLVFLIDYGFVTFFMRDYSKVALTPDGTNPTVYLRSIGLLCCTVGSIVTVVASVASLRRLFPTTAFAVTLGLYFISMVVEGDRSGLMLLVVPILLARHYWIRPISWRRAVALGTVTLLLFTGMKAFRGTKHFEAAVDVARELGPVGSTVSEMGKTLDTFVRAMTLVPERFDYFGGMTYVWALARSVPNFRLTPRQWGFVSSVWVTYETDLDKYRRKGGVGFSIAAEAFINFGALGVPLFLVALGILHGRSERWLTVTHPNFTRVVLFLLLEVSLLLHVRNTAVVYVRNFVWMSCLLVAILLVAHATQVLSARAAAPLSRWRSPLRNQFTPQAHRSRVDTFTGFLRPTRTDPRRIF